MLIDCIIMNACSIRIEPHGDKTGVGVQNEGGGCFIRAGLLIRQSLIHNQSFFINSSTSATCDLIFIVIHHGGRVQIGVQVECLSV